MTKIAFQKADSDLLVFRDGNEVPFARLECVEEPTDWNKQDAGWFLCEDARPRFRLTPIAYTDLECVFALARLRLGDVSSKMPHPNAVARLLHQSWKDIDGKYEMLTESERECITLEQHRDVSAWLCDVVDRYVIRLRDAGEPPDGGTGLLMQSMARSRGNKIRPMCWTSVDVAADYLRRCLAGVGTVERISLGDYVALCEK